MDFLMQRRHIKGGVDDLTMISKLEESEVVSNLKTRFSNDLIYSYIGHVLISVNPFKNVPIYSDAILDAYKGKHRHELPPHIFAIADAAYRNMVSDAENQCIIISGESGAGKTEASKKVMQYVAAVAGQGDEVNRVKNIILESNPLLEAFGNAKTIRNNNSSRFGKYLEIEFDVSGNPSGGKVSNYLLEKSRVVRQNEGERNFHIFYQLCAGVKSTQKFGIQGPEQFAYLSSSGCFTVDGMDDVAEYKDMTNAMNAMGINANEQESILSTLAAILWTGNISFQESGSNSVVKDQAVVDYAASLLGVDPEKLKTVMLFREIHSGRGSIYNSPQTIEQAAAARDALTKAIYDRLFNQIVAYVNTAMKKDDAPLVIGVLDIYGFEIFGQNGFEQFCINYVNEKLQQLFIELTLKSEQEEYAQEGIEWKPIAFFNNKVVCDLVELKNPPGIFSILDDVCSTVHTVTEGIDIKFCEKLKNFLGTNKHFSTTQNVFQVKHYAGNVDYLATGFCEKNRDTLFKEFVDLMNSSTNPFVQGLFPDKIDSGSRKRPTTAGFKIRGQANGLVNTLMACNPHYVRCIKPNETKKGGDWDETRVKHQCQYLGLLENIRVRRAGFAYRNTFERFLDRYKILSARTYPKPWVGDTLQGCVAILEDVNMPKDQYQAGRTKIFVKDPESLFSLEDQRDNKFNDIARRIQRCWKRFKAREHYIELRAQAANVLLNKKERRRLSVIRPFQGEYISVADDKTLSQLFETHKYNKKERIVFADRGKRLDEDLQGKTCTVILTNAAIYFFGTSSRLNNSTKQNVDVPCLLSRLQLASLASVSLSTMADDFIVFHTQSGTTPPSGSKPTWMDNKMTRNCCFCSATFSLMFRKQHCRGCGKIFCKNCTSMMNLSCLGYTEPSVKVCDHCRFLYSVQDTVLENACKTEIVVVLKDQLKATGRDLPISFVDSIAFTGLKGQRQISFLSAAGIPDVAPSYPAVGGKEPATQITVQVPPGLPKDTVPKAGGATKRTARPAGAPQAQKGAAPVAQAAAAQVSPGSAVAAATKQFGGVTLKPAGAPPPAPQKRLPRATVLWDYEAQFPEELTLKKGDVITIRTKNTDGWWDGEIGGRHGLFPYNYVEEIKEEKRIKSAGMNGVILGNPTQWLAQQAQQAAAKAQYVADTEAFEED